MITQNPVHKPFPVIWRQLLRRSCVACSLCIVTRCTQTFDGAALHVIFTFRLCSCMSSWLWCFDLIIASDYTRLIALLVPSVSIQLDFLSIPTPRQALNYYTGIFNSEINRTRCNNCVYSSQWLYSTCFGWQFHPSSGIQYCIWLFR